MQILAEVGSNWKKYESNRKNWEIAKKQIMMAKEYGATAVKFQLFTAAELYGPQVLGTKFGRTFDQFALPEDWLGPLKEECDQAELKFLCSAFSVKGFKTVDKFVDTHKLASPEGTDPSLIDWLMRCEKPFYYSDGCGVEHLGQGIPMACVSEYPANFMDYELYGNVGYEWGLSDHTLTEDLAVLALANGATHFEKHVDFCWGEGAKTPDSVVSVRRDPWCRFVEAIRDFDEGRYDKIRAKSRALYGRRKTAEGYFRPIPESADLSPIYPVGSKL